VLHPRVAVLLGVEKRWHIPLLFCRALSTAPAAWWGLRCVLTFLDELLMGENPVMAATPWGVERRFRVTEVFLAVLWVWNLSPWKAAGRLPLYLPTLPLRILRVDLLLFWMCANSGKVLCKRLSIFLLHGLPNVSLVSYPFTTPRSHIEAAKRHSC
jgi:hypothetical protein